MRSCQEGPFFVVVKSTREDTEGRNNSINRAEEFLEEQVEVTERRKSEEQEETERRESEEQASIL